MELNQLSLQQILNELLPDCHIINTPNELQTLSTATFETTAQYQIWVQVKHKQDVAKLLKFANEHQLGVYPISQGKNWGFGSKASVDSCSILLDLSLLDKISNYHQKFGSVSCQAGVTFAQLSEFLSAQGNHHFVSMIGGSPEASVVGNILERGDGTGDYCERWLACCNFEAVLADGSIVRTQVSGSRRSDDSNTVRDNLTSHLVKSGFGPCFQDMLLQSNFAVITQVTLWLQHVPENFRSYSFALSGEDKLSDVLEELFNLYQRKILTSPITFWNDYKRIANSVQVPRHLTADSLPVTKRFLQQISDDYAPWYAFGGIYIDDAALGKSVIRRLFKAVRPYIKSPTIWSTLSKRKIALFKRFNHFMNLKCFNFDQLIDSWYKNTLLGQVGASSMRSMYWRKAQEVSHFVDPNQLQCGIFWIAFSMPFEGKQIRAAFQAIEQRVLAHSFEPLLSFITLNDRYIRVFLQLTFDKSIPEEVAKAHLCQQSVLTLLKELDCILNRLDILTMQGENLYQDDKLHNLVKNALDPNSILAKGRYFMR